MRLGGHIFTDTKDPAELARAYKQFGYRAAYCPKDLTIKETERIKALRESFAKEDITIAEVGAWCNPLDPRQEEAERNIGFITEKLAVAEELGANCCVNVIGTYSTEHWYGAHEKNFTVDAFEASVEIARKIIDAVKPKRTKLTFEIMPYNFLDTAESYIEFLKAVDRKEAAVHLDPVNLVNSPRTYFNNARLTEESFKILGPYIASIHAKDIIIQPAPCNTHLDEVRPGSGIFNYRVLLKCAASLPIDVPVMMEHLPDAEEYALGRDYIRKVAAEIGVML